MAKWLRTTSSRSYVFGGKVIPNSLSGDYLELTDDDYLKMSDNPVLSHLLRLVVLSFTAENLLMSRFPMRSFYVRMKS